MDKDANNKEVYGGKYGDVDATYIFNELLNDKERLNSLNMTECNQLIGKVELYLRVFTKKMFTI